MNLDAGLFLYSHYSISGIQYRKGRCVIFSSKIECRFYDWSLVFYAIYTYYSESVIQYLEFVFEMFIYETE